MDEGPDRLLARNRWFSFYAAIACCAVLISDVAFRWMPEPRVVGRLGTILLILGFAIAYFRLSYETHVAPEPDVPRASSLLPEVHQSTIDQLIDEHGYHRIGFEQLLLFVHALIYPRRIFSRISDDVTQMNRSTLIKTTFTISTAWVHDHFDGSASPQKSEFAASPTAGDFVIPLIVPKKGEVIDGLRVFDAKDGRVSTLAVSPALEFYLAVLRMYIRMGARGDYRRYREDVEPRVIEVLRRPHGASARQLNQVVGLVRALTVSPGREARIDDFIVILRTLNEFSPICALVPSRAIAEMDWPYLHRLRLERRFVGRIVQAPSIPRRRFKSMLDTARLALGVRLSPIYVPLVNATRCVSYHLQVSGPEGTYLASQEILARESKYQNGHLQPRLGQRRAHFYTRNFRSADGRYLAAAFFERAPGSLATASLAALAGTVVIGLLAVREILSPGTSTPNVPLVSTLLAIPIGVAALSGIDPSKESRHPSLFSRSVTFATIVASLAAFALTVLPSSLHIPEDVTDRLWALLAFWSAGIAVVSVLSWFMRLRVEHRFKQAGHQDDVVAPTRSSSGLTGGRR